MSFGNRLLTSFLVFLAGAVIATAWWYSTTPHGQGHKWLAIVGAVIMLLGIVGILAAPRSK